MNQQTYLASGRKVLSLSAAFLLGLSFLTSCKKESSSIGLNNLDPEYLLSSGATDTFQISTYTTVEDSIPTDGQSLFLLGAYNDPKMGTFNSSFYTQLRLTKSLDFNSSTDTPTIDSVVLSLRLVELYGEADQQTFSVERVTEEMYYDSSYYKFSTLTTDGIERVIPGDANQSPNIDDSVYVGSIKQGPQLRLHLDNQFGLDIMNAAVAGTFTNNDGFQDYFYGLRVSVTNGNPASGTGGVMYIDPSNNITEMTIYYKINGGTAQELAFDMGGSSQYFNHVEINNSASVTNTIDNPLFGNTTFYAQAFQNRAVIDFPSIVDIPKNSVIHDALLVVPVAHQTSALYEPSGRITAAYYDEDVFRANPSIYYSETDKRYVIDLRDYVQGIVSGELTYSGGIYLFPTFFSSRAERIIFNGINSSNKHKPQLIIKYTEFK